MGIIILPLTHLAKFSINVVIFLFIGIIIDILDGTTTHFLSATAQIVFSQIKRVFLSGHHQRDDICVR